VVWVKGGEEPRTVWELSGRAELGCRPPTPFPFPCLVSIGTLVQPYRRVTPSSFHRVDTLRASLSPWPVSWGTGSGRSPRPSRPRDEDSDRTDGPRWPDTENKAAQYTIEPAISVSDDLSLLVTSFARSTQSPWVQCWALNPKPRATPQPAAPNHSHRQPCHPEFLLCIVAHSLEGRGSLAPKSRQVPVCVPPISSQLRTSISPTGCPHVADLKIRRWY
jgi:hypothetical protein